MSAVGTRAAADTARVTAERAVTLLRDERTSVPLALPRTGRVLYLSVLDYPANWRIAAPSRTMLPELRKRWASVTAVELSDRSTADELDLVRAMAGDYDAVVAGVFVRASSGSGRLDLGPGVVRLLQDLSAARRAPRAAAGGGVLRQSRMRPWPHRRCRRCSSPTTWATTPRPRPCARLPARLPSRDACRWPLARALAVGFGLTRAAVVPSPQ